MKDVKLDSYVSKSTEKMKIVAFPAARQKILKNRRYCSIKCRQHLRQKLNMRSGLLQTLNTRYATFYFSEQ